MTSAQVGIGVDLRHLRYFIAVAEELHFGRAARRLHMSQPPLSQQIRHLERELGVVLLSRDSHSVRLTPAGAALLAEAPKLLAAVERLSRLVRSLGDEPAGPLRIGFIGPTVSAVNSRILSVIADRYPGVIPELEEMSSSQQVREVLAGALDVGMAWETVEDRGPDPQIEKVTLFEDPVAVAMAPDNPLASELSVRVEHLANQRLIMFRRQMNPLIHDAIIGTLRSHGVSPSLLYSDGGGVLDLVAAGFGVCISHTTQLLAPSHGIVTLPFAEPLFSVRLVLMWLRDNKLSALDRFVRVARELEASGQLA
jgi:DNA-binding transcriptional LysR family regulator